MRRSDHRRTLAFAVLLLLGMLAVIVAGCGRDVRPAGPPTSMAIGGGDRVSYREARPTQPDAPATSSGSPATAATGVGTAPVVFLHGASYDSSVWERTGLLTDVARLGHRAVALDLPGKGASTGETSADWLARVLDELGIDRAVIVAPSAGGAVGLPFLAAHPERVAGLVAVSPVGGADFGWTGGEPPPVVVVQGASDTGFAAGNKVLAAELPGARLVVIPDAGHAAYEDRPAAFLDAMRPLL